MNPMQISSSLPLYIGSHRYYRSRLSRVGGCAGSNQKSERFKCVRAAIRNRSDSSVCWASQATSSGKINLERSSAVLWIHPVAARHLYKTKHQSCKTSAKPCGKLGTSGTAKCLRRYCMPRMDSMMSPTSQQCNSKRSRQHQHRQSLHWKPRRENRKICLHVLSILGTRAFVVIVRIRRR